MACARSTPPMSEGAAMALVPTSLRILPSIERLTTPMKNSRKSSAESSSKSPTPAAARSATVSTIASLAIASSMVPTAGHNNSVIATNTSSAVAYGKPSLLNSQRASPQHYLNPLHHYHP